MYRKILLSLVLFLVLFLIQDATSLVSCSDICTTCNSGSWSSSCCNDYKNAYNDVSACWDSLSCSSASACTSSCTSVNSCLESDGGGGSESCDVSVYPSTLSGAGSVDVDVEYVNVGIKPNTANIKCGNGNNAAGVSCTGNANVGSCSGTCTYAASPKTYVISATVIDVACSPNSVTVSSSPTSPPVSCYLTPSRTSTYADKKEYFNVYCRDSNDQITSCPSLVWSETLPDGGSHIESGDSNGAFLQISANAEPGNEGKIIATSNNPALSCSADVFIVSPTLIPNKCSIQPNPVTVPSGSTQQFSASCMSDDSFTDCPDDLVWHELFIDSAVSIGRSSGLLSVGAINIAEAGRPVSVSSESNSDVACSALVSTLKEMPSPSPSPSPTLEPSECVNGWYNETWFMEVGDVTPAIGESPSLYSFALMEAAADGSKAVVYGKHYSASDYDLCKNFGKCWSTQVTPLKMPLEVPDSQVEARVYYFGNDFEAPCENPPCLESQGLDFSQLRKLSLADTNPIEKLSKLTFEVACQDTDGGGVGSTPVITYPSATDSSDDDAWGISLSFKYRVGVSGEKYSCRYYLAEYPNIFTTPVSLGDVNGGVESSKLLTGLKQVKYSLQVSCALKSEGKYRNSDASYFTIHEDGKPIIVSPPQHSVIWGKQTPLSASFKVGGSSAKYSCSQVLDDFEEKDLGLVDNSELNSLNALPLLGEWNYGEHSLAIRCFPEGRQSEEKNSDPLLYEVVGKNTPVITQPLPDATYFGDVPLEFTVSGDYSTYSCYAKGVGQDSFKYSVRNQQTILDSLDSLSPGDYTLFVECKGDPNGQVESSESINFTQLEPDTPYITTPQDGELILFSNLTYSFMIGNNFESYDCDGILKDKASGVLQTLAIGEIDVADGEDTAFYQNTLLALNNSNYSLSISCRGVEGGFGFNEFNSLSFDNPVKTDENNFTVNSSAIPSGQFVNKPVIYVPTSGSNWTNSPIPLNFSVSGSFAQYSCDAYVDNASFILGTVNNSLLYSTEFTEVDAGTHTLFLNCSAVGNSSYYNASDVIGFYVNVSDVIYPTGSGENNGNNACSCSLDDVCSSCCEEVNRLDLDCIESEGPEGNSLEPGQTQPFNPSSGYTIELICPKRVSDSSQEISVVATLANNGIGACDTEGLRALFISKTSKGELKLKSSADCSTTGKHVFSLSSKETTTYKIRVESTKGAVSEECSFRVGGETTADQPFLGISNDLWVLIILLLMISAGGAYYYWKKKKEENAEDFGNTETANAGKDEITEESLFGDARDFLTGEKKTSSEEASEKQ